MAQQVDIDTPPASSPELLWALEQMRRLAQRIYELEEQIEEMNNGA